MRKLAWSVGLFAVLLVVVSSLHLTLKVDAPGSRQQVLRISQLDPQQYRSTAEYTTWASSTCSTAAMTEVMNYYGRHLRITDVLAVESNMEAITPQLGLLADDGIARTVARFGFRTQWGYQYSLDQVIDLANQGTPVIVGFPPERYPGGHLVVVTGGTNTLVELADSSIWNRHTLTRTRFLKWWAGFVAVVTPQDSGSSANIPRGGAVQWRAVKQI
jgi:ABC-type bacteriocin/lantibiotic exporter with double-glycine peptidase domain